MITRLPVAILLLSLSLTPALASAQREATGPWTEALAAARRAHAAGRHGTAAARFAEVDQALGGYPYDEGEYDDAGQSLLAPERSAIRSAIQCPWALSALAGLRGRSDEVVQARADALARARLSCDGPAQAVAAALLRDPLQAALRIGAGTLPAPFASRAPTAEQAAWARAASAGAFPPARDVAEALRFVRAHASAEHGLGTRCELPFGLQVTRADERLTVPDWDEEIDEDVVTAPFAARTPDPIAFVRCTFEEAISPYEEPGMGPGAQSVIYVLTREQTSVRIAGRFRGFWDHECWTGIVQGIVSHYAIPLPGGGRLYAIRRVEGYAGYDDDQQSYLTEELVLCDLVRGVCRTLPVSIERTSLELSGDEYRPIRFAWQSAVSFEGGLVRLVNVRGAPSVLRRFGAGVPLDQFFSEPPVGREEATLFPIRPPRPAANASCPWRIADPDGQTNVRPAPGTTQQAVGTVANGTEIVPVERRGRWWRIEAPVAGWVWAANARRVCP